MLKNEYIVVKNERIAQDIYEMEIETDLMAKPGQFINIDVKRADLLLRRPISISNIENNRLTISYRVVGEGTEALSTINVGESLNILAPLGNGFPLVKNQNVLIVGCGMGVAPMYFLAKELAKYNKLTIVLAYTNEKLAYYEHKFDDLGEVYLATNDGSLGFKGNVLELLDSQKIAFETLYACGPGVVLKALDTKYQNSHAGYLSFEERMACGIGACYGCVIETKMGMKRVCKDGPVFAFGEVNYEFKR